MTAKPPAPVSIFYMDDSGTRHPDHQQSPEQKSQDWFALGGVLIDEEEKPRAERLIKDFLKRWPQMNGMPFHSHEIRRKQKGFEWLGRDKAVADLFIDQLSELLLDLPVIGIGCVIDRTGYNLRYAEKYKADRWSLCKTAFAVAVERAVKHTSGRGRRLRVYVERCTKEADDRLLQYYDTMRADGLWFDAGQSSKYNPGDANLFQSCLFEFRTRTKSSLLMQIADLYLWPMCVAGYDSNNRPYIALRDAGKLIDSHVPPDLLEERGIKYSCFDAAEPKK